MFTTYEEVVNYLYRQLPVYQNQGQEAYRPGLEKTFEFCRELGNPQNDFDSIHVAGTNGKGSVSHMISAVFQSTGKKIGLYTSPHLIDFTERIKINGKPIPKEDVINFVNEKKSIIDKLSPTFFELTVAMSFYFFSAYEVDLGIIETGLGGRLDSTNIIQPKISVITNIALEHTEVLGDNEASIATEKAGIIKFKVPIIIGQSNPKTDPVFIEKSNETESPISFADKEWKILDMKMQDVDKMQFWIQNQHNGRAEYYAIDSIAQYQQFNIVTALETIFVWNQTYPSQEILQHQIEYGLAHFCELSSFMGRMQVLQKEPLLIVDVAHNPAGIKESLEQIQAFKKKTSYVLAFSKNKDIESIIQILPENGFYYFCKFDSERSWDPLDYQEQIKQKCKNHSFINDSEEALKLAMRSASNEDCIACLGSVFLVSEILNYYHGARYI